MDAIRQCRAELIATQSWLQGEVAVRKELAAARAELHRLRAIDCAAKNAMRRQCDGDATLN
jgi:hypothetical protein